MREYFNPKTGKIEFEMTPEKGEVGAPGPVGIRGEKGDKGDKGDRGDKGDSIIGPRGERGSIWFCGNGAPAKIDGSLAGDKYLDNDTGDIYELS